MHIQRRVFAPWRIWRQKTRVCSERQRQSALVAAIGLLKDAALRGSVSRPGANHVHDRATRSFSLCQRRVWPRGRSPPFLSFRLSPVRVAFVSSGPRKRTSSFCRENRLICARLICASSLLSNAICARVSSFNQIRQSAFPGG